MSKEEDADREFLLQRRADLGRLWTSLQPHLVRHDNPALLAELKTAVDGQIGAIERHFANVYTPNGFLRTAGDRAFRACLNQLALVSETVDSLATPIGREQINTIIELLVESQARLDDLMKVHVHPTVDPPDVEPDPQYDPREQLWYPHQFPSTVDGDHEDVLRYRATLDLVIMTVTDVELDAVMRLVAPLPERGQVLQLAIGNQTYYLGVFGRFQVAVTTSRMGSLSAGASIHTVDRAYQHWLPRAIVMVGIAFGADDRKQRIGDVLVANRVISYEPERKGERWEFRGGELESSLALLDRFQHSKNWNFRRPDGVKCECRIGPVLSGEKLVDELDFKQKLLHHFPKAIGGEMEGAGLSASARYNHGHWILVKAICDWADGKKDKRHQALAAAAAVSLVHHVLMRPTALEGLAKPTMIPT